MKLKKTIKILVIILIVLILAVVILFKLFGNRAIKAGIEVAGTQALKVPVTVGGVGLSLLAGKAGIDDLVIANPEGYANPTMMEIGKGRVNLAVGSLMSDTVRIEDILLDDVVVTLEQKGLTNNIQQILKNLPKSEETPKEEPDQPDEGAGKNLEITKLELTNINVKVKLLPVPGKADTLSLKLAPIKMENLGSDSKMDMVVLTNKILLAIVAGIAQQGAGIIPDEILGPMGDTLKALGGAAEELIKETGKILEGGAEAGKDILEGTKDIGKGVEDIGKGIGDIFKKKEDK